MRRRVEYPSPSVGRLMGSASFYKYCPARRAVEILRTRILRFTPPLFFNDPFEFRPSLLGRAIGDGEVYDRELLDLNSLQPLGILHDIVSRFNDRVGILSLTADCRNLLMWSHYGENHSGAAIEFDASNNFFKSATSDDGLLNVLGKVKYTDKRPTLTDAFLRSVNYQFLSARWSAWLTLLAERHDLFFTKSKQWAHEREWRLVRQLKSGDDAVLSRLARLSGHGLRGAIPSNLRTIDPSELRSVPAEAIRSVILGACCRRQGTGDIDGLEEVVWKVILSDRSLSHVKVKRAVLSPTRYEVVVFDTEDPDELRRHLPQQEVQWYEAGFAGREAAKADLESGTVRPCVFSIEEFL